jgi:hypothetical protein
MVNLTMATVATSYRKAGILFRFNSFAGFIMMHKVS